MGCHNQPPHLKHEPLGDVVLVGTDGLLAGTLEISSHHLGSLPLAIEVGPPDPAVDDQSVAFAHRHVAPATREGQMGLASAGQQDLKNGVGAMSADAELDGRYARLHRAGPEDAAKGIGLVLP